MTYNKINTALSILLNNQVLFVKKFSISLTEKLVSIKKIIYFLYDFIQKKIYQKSRFSDMTFEVNI